MDGMRDARTYMKCCAVLIVLLALAGCQNTPKIRLGSYIDVTKIDNTAICSSAIKFEYPVYDASSTNYKKYVAEAKRRGLTESQCARLTGWFTEKQLAAASSKINVHAAASYNPRPRNLSSESRPYICTSAINEKSLRWETGEIWQGHVNEAKRRGLTELKCSRVARYINDTQYARQSGNTNRIKTNTQITPSRSTPPKTITTEMVEEAQRLLISISHLSGRADGVAGPKTIAAIKSFQKSQNDPQTGQINGNFIASLRQANRERIRTAKVDVAKSLAQLREDQNREKSRLAELKRQTQEREQELAALSKPPPAHSAIPTNINFGNYHALVIGINNYRSLPRLKTAVADARAVAEVLTTRYGFAVTSLINPTRDQIVDKLDDLRATLTPTDNLLIYYAGHGWLDGKADQGFWLPVDAEEKRTSNWIANDKITGTLKAIEAKHVIVVADSCYSGKLVRGVELALASNREANYLQQISRKKTRMAMSSGGLKPVEDGNGKHSPFARAFLKALNENEKVMDGTSLFKAVREPVMLAADQTPEYSPIRRADHDGGDFLFVRRK